MIKDGLNRDVSELSSLIYRISIASGLPVADSEPDQSLRAEGPEGIGRGIVSDDAEAVLSPVSVVSEVPGTPSSFDSKSVAAARESVETEDAPEESRADGESGFGVEVDGEAEADSASANETPVEVQEQSAQPDEDEGPVLAPVDLAPAATAVLPSYDADAVSERDLIGVDRFVDAFAYLIAARTMQPPLAVGLFGNWGSGKTFLMRSVQRRVDEITRGARESNRDQAKIGVYKRVVQIEFNAWHYVEGNLWASLVDHIFSNLRTSAEEPRSQLDDRRKALTEKLVSTRDEQRRIGRRIEHLEKEREEKQSEVTRLEATQRDHLKQAEKLRMSDVAAAATLKTDEVQAVDDALSKVGVSFDQTSAVDAAHSLDDARDLVVSAGVILGPIRQYGLRWAVLLVCRTSGGAGHRRSDRVAQAVGLNSGLRLDRGDRKRRRPRRRARREMDGSGPQQD